MKKIKDVALGIITAIGGFVDEERAVRRRWKRLGYKCALVPLLSLSAVNEGLGQPARGAVQDEARTTCKLLIGQCQSQH